MFLDGFSEHTRGGDGDDDAFIQGLKTRRWHRVDNFVIGGWILIVVKCVLASIAIARWDIPIGDFYVWGPSFIFGGLCTYLYLTREES